MLSACLLRLASMTSHLQNWLTIWPELAASLWVSAPWMQEVCIMKPICQLLLYSCIFVLQQHVLPSGCMRANVTKWEKSLFGAHFFCWCYSSKKNKTKLRYAIKRSEYCFSSFLQIWFFLMHFLCTSFVTVSVMQTDSWSGCLKERAVQSHHRKTNKKIPYLNNRVVRFPVDLPLNTNRICTKLSGLFWVFSIGNLRFQ